MDAPGAIRRTIRPTHPGEMLREDFMSDYGLTVAGLAQALGVSRQTINELLRERRALSPEMALRLARLFGNSPEFWLNAQRAVDLWDAEQSVDEDVGKIKPLRVASRAPAGPPSRLDGGVEDSPGQFDCYQTDRLDPGDILATG